MNDRRPVSPNVVLCLIVVIVLGSIFAVMYVTTSGREPTITVALISAFAAPTVTAMLSYINTDRIKHDVTTIKHNTNGTLSELRAEVETLNTQLRSNTTTPERGE